MARRLSPTGVWRFGPRIALISFLAYAGVAFGGDRDYPLEGKVVALGTNRELIGGGTTNVNTALHRTYTVKSLTRVYVLECHNWMDGFHIHSAKECGGSKTIGIGDVVHFRMVKSFAYIPTDSGKEQKLSVLSEAASEPAQDAINP